MATDVDAFLRDLARVVTPRADEWAGMVLERLRDELPELWRDDDLTPLALKETAAHVTAFLRLLEHGLDETRVSTPEVATGIARRFARAGVPISKLLRAYRLGHVCLLQLIQSETCRLTDDWQLINAAGVRLIATGFEYVDQGSEEVVAAYQEERDHRLRRRLLVTNEASRRIGTTLDTTLTARELAEVGTDDFADLVTVDLFEFVLQENGAPPTTLRRVAQRSAPDGGPDPAVTTGRTHTYPPDSDAARALATGQSFLHHVTPSDAPDRTDHPDIPGIHSALLLPLRARGDTLGLARFFRHRTAAPFDQEDLLLAQEIAARAAVSIDNARRYTHERSTALTLQRSLLPHRTVAQPAVETAFRYLPSGYRTGVGGDWYDVIPLSGARVALVVGDVVGRGLHAAATMGGLRTAVRAFADIDLMPDELLTHLDDVVIRLQREAAQDDGDGDVDGETSATCLYAVYDPVSRQCSMASAGHVLPAVALPPAAPGRDQGPRTVDFPDAPIGPPLGLGGLPFETAQFELPEGSLLALFTNGLIQSRTRDVDAARTLLGDVLAGAPESPDEICDRVLAALLPDGPADDVALLVARTRALDPGHVATLDLPSDPAAVSGARGFTDDTLTAWGLEELAFTTELMVSELVTNAVRYGKSPVQLRLILQSTLTCEVFDASSTAPHLRHARTYDEGGRGLLLVAQLADRWGTRHSREGKVIWAEQVLPAEGRAAW
ncbi:ATP-binding SpoIIE family protein phosphatase [Streptomyces sp. NPDC001595]|uniref:ATP-binding SpoIIE family protein phosphatase n=1 Tax=Streptomyces sp. NPDC001532 TaxID=3154520 RepID=UPI003325A50B